MSGPHGGPQPEVTHCPICMARLENVASRSKKPPISHSYRCSKCGHRFEINEQGVG